MVKKTINPKVLIHLTISPDMKQFLIDNNINASELLEKSIAELMEISKNIIKEDLSQYYEDVKKYLEHFKILTHPIDFENKVYFRERQIQAMNILRHKLGFNYEDSKKLLERYVKEKQKEIEENKEEFEDWYRSRNENY